MSKVIQCNECGALDKFDHSMWLQIDYIHNYQNLGDIEYPMHFCSVECLLKFWTKRKVL